MVEQRGGERRLGHFGYLVFAAGPARTHERHAAVGHDGLHVGEVHVYITFPRDEFGNTLGCRRQNVVGLAEGLFQRQRTVYLGNVVVVDYHERIHVFAQLFEPPVGLVYPLASLCVEGQGNDADGEDTPVAGRLGDDRCGSRTRTAPHDEYHLGTLLFKAQHDVVETLYRGLPSLVGVVACAEPFAELNLDGNGAGIEGLPVGIADHEGDVRDTQVVHVVHGVAARTADSQYHDDGGILFRQLDAYDYFVFVCHCLVRFIFRRHRRPRRFP